MAIDDSQHGKTAMPLVLPALLVRVWGRGLDEIDELIRRHPHPPQPLGGGRYAYLPEPGDPAVVEAGLHLASRLFGGSPPLQGLRCLVHPIRVRSAGARWLPEHDELDEELRAAPPELRPGKVYLSGHAVHELESRWIVEQRGAYRRPSGRSVTLFELLGPRFDLPPWRNTEVLGRMPVTVDRAVVGEIQERLGRDKVVAVAGPLGAGKTRAVVEALRRSGLAWLWATAWPPRSGGPQLEAQLAKALLELTQRGSGAAPPALRALGDGLTAAAGWSVPPLAGAADILTSALGQLAPGTRLAVVVDDLERADGANRALVDRLVRLAAEGDSLRLVLVGRPGDWHAAAGAAPVAVPPATAEEADVLWHQLVAPLKIPEAVVTRLQTDAGGLPFVAEELLLQLARRRALRQLYGSFFFSAADDIVPEASERLVRHVLAEVPRLGEAEPARLLAHAPRGLDPTLQAFAATRAAADWHRPFVAGGLMREESREPLLVGFLAPAFAAALRSSVPGRAGERLRDQLTRSLGGRVATHRATWEEYQLAAGQPQGIPILLDLLKQTPDSIPPESLFEAARLELERHRARGGDEATELELLWGLLRLARRVGALSNLGAALDRALALTAGDPKRQLTLWSLKAEHAQNAGQLELAEQSLRQALAFAQGESPARQTLLLIQLGKLVQLAGRLDEAGRLFATLAARLGGSGNTALAATCRYYQGNLLLQQQRLDEALKAHQESLASRESAGLHSQAGQSLSAIGSVWLARGDYAAALDTYRRALAMLEEHGAPAETSYALLGLARVLNRLGATAEALQRARRGVELRAQLDDAVGEALARLDLAESHLLRLELPEALRQARRAHFQLALLRQERHMAAAEQLLGRILLRQKAHDAARQRLESALRLHLEHRLVHAAIFDQRWLLEQALELGDATAVDNLARNISLLLDSVAYPERGEHVDLRLFQAFEWLKARGAGDTEPLPFLRRASTNLLRRAAPLDPTLRHTFLLQVPQNREIVELAAARGVAKANGPPPPPVAAPGPPPSRSTRAT